MSDRRAPSACAANSLLFPVRSFTSASSRSISTVQARNISSSKTSTPLDLDLWIFRLQISRPLNLLLSQDPWTSQTLGTSRLTCREFRHVRYDECVRCDERASPMECRVWEMTLRYLEVCDVCVCVCTLEP